MWTLDYCSPKDITTYDKSITIDSTKPLSELKLKLAEVAFAFAMMDTLLFIAMSARVCLHVFWLNHLPLDSVYMPPPHGMYHAFLLAMFFFVYSRLNVPPLAAVRSLPRRVQAVRGHQLCELGRAA